MFNLTNISLVIDSLFSLPSIFILSLVFLIFVLYIHDKREGYFFSGVLISTGILIGLLKNLFDKARPIDMLIEQDGFAFPSGHTAISLVFFVSLAHLFSKHKSIRYKLVSYIIAGLLSIFVGFTRIYLNVHDSYDVIGGFILGGIVLAVGIWIYEKKKV